MQNETTNNDGAGSIPTAVELALASTDPSPHPYTDHFLSERDRTSGPPVRRFNQAAHTVNGQRVEFNRKQFIEWMQTEDAADMYSTADWASLVKQAQEKFPDAAHELSESLRGWRASPMFGLAGPEEIQTLREITADMAAINSASEPFSLSNISKRQHAARDEQAAALRSGSPAPALLPTRDQIFADSLARLNAYNAQLVEITQTRLLPLARTILERFDVIATDFLRRTEMRDREACAIMGIEFHPSLEWKCAAQVAIEFSPNQRLPKSPTAVASPRGLVGDLIEF